LSAALTLQLIIVKTHLPTILYYFSNNKKPIFLEEMANTPSRTLTSHKYSIHHPSQ